MPAGMAALSHGMAKCIYTRGCTGVRPAFAAIVFVSQLFDIIKAVQLLLWQAIAFSFFFLVLPLNDIMILSLLLTFSFVLVFAPLVLRFSSRVFPFRFVCCSHLPARLVYLVLVLRTTEISHFSYFLILFYYFIFRCVDRDLISIILFRLGLSSVRQPF